MSYKNSNLEALVKEIKDLGSGGSTSDILYHLFDGDDVAEAFGGGSLLEGADYKQAEVRVSDYLSERGYELLETDGGGEGGTEYCYGVIKLGDEHYKAEWAYYSYSGCEYDNIENTVKLVTPKEKTVTVYE